MHHALNIDELQRLIMDKVTEEGDIHSRRTIATLRYVHPLREISSERLFGRLGVKNLEGFAEVLSLCSNIGQYLTEVEIGDAKDNTTQVNPHTLEVVLRHLPKAIVVVHPVTIVPALVLPILQAGGAYGSYVFVVSSAPLQPLSDALPTVGAGIGAGVFASNTRMAMLADGTWSSESGTVERLWVQGVRGEGAMEDHLQQVGTIIPADTSIAVAFHPSTMLAAASFAKFLQMNGDALTSIHLLWTNAEGQLLDDSLNYHLALGVAASHRLQSLTLGLFVGSNATSTLEEQMACLVALIQAASRETLRLLSLVITVHEDKEVYEYVQQLDALDWHALTDTLVASEYPNFREIRFNVGGCSDFVAMDVGTVLYQHLVPGQRVPVTVRAYPIPTTSQPT